MQFPGKALYFWSRSSKIRLIEVSTADIWLQALCLSMVDFPSSSVQKWRYFHFFGYIWLNIMSYKCTYLLCVKFARPLVHKGCFFSIVLRDVLIKRKQRCCLMCSSTVILNRRLPALCKVVGLNTHWTQHYLQLTVRVGLDKSYLNIYFPECFEWE